MEDTNKKNNNIDILEDLQKIKDFIRLLWTERKLFYKTCGCAVVLALVVAFSVPKRYTVEVALAPESGGSMDMGGLSSLASMAGINIGAMGNNDAIGPDLYPMIVHSKDYLVRLFDIPVKTMDGELATTYYDYLLEHQKIAWWGYPMKGLGKLMKLISPEKEDSLPMLNGQRNYMFLTPKERSVIEILQTHIVCNVDKKNGIIRMQVTEQDPLIAAVIADSVRVALNNFIIEYRTNKARQDYNYMNNLYKEAQAEYARTQAAYTSFADANLNLNSVRAQIKKDDLEKEMQLAYTVYSQLANQLQVVKAKIQESTPAYTVLESSTVPERASSPKKLLLLVAFGFLACVGTTGWIVWKKIIKG
ncbi:MAG: chain-length determining protein [Bacteroidaceae bacterium]|nr:chain-length determining protein [Bacteroidaceae bacterium]MBR3896331.1 chain-length determining protein [Bacteroidaceae bacterium]